MRIFLVSVDAAVEDTVAQCAAVAANLRHERGLAVRAVYASLDNEVRSAADLIAAELGLPPAALLDGATPSAASDPDWTAIEALVAGSEANDVCLLVGSDSTLRELVGEALAMQPESRSRFQVRPWTLTTLEFRNQRTILAGLNDGCHLDA
jgi:broad specificity phosphatase PhoE